MFYHKIHPVQKCCIHEESKSVIFFSFSFYTKLTYLVLCIISFGLFAFGFTYVILVVNNYHEDSK